MKLKWILCKKKSQRILLFVLTMSKDSVVRVNIEEDDEDSYGDSDEPVHQKPQERQVHTIGSYDQNCSVKQGVAAAALTIPCTDIPSTKPKHTDPGQISQFESPKSDDISKTEPCDGDVGSVEEDGGFGCIEIGKHWGKFMIPFRLEKKDSER